MFLHPDASLIELLEKHTMSKPYTITKEKAFQALQSLLQTSEEHPYAMFESFTGNIKRKPSNYPVYT